MHPPDRHLRVLIHGSFTFCQEIFQSFRRSKRTFLFSRGRKVGRVFFARDDDEPGRQLPLCLAPRVQVRRVRASPAQVRVTRAALVLRPGEDVPAAAQRQPRAAPSGRSGSARVSLRSRPTLSRSVGHRQHTAGNKIRTLPRKVEPRTHQSQPGLGGKTFFLLKLFRFLLVPKPSRMTMIRSFPYPCHVRKLFSEQFWANSFFDT